VAHVVAGLVGEQERSIAGNPGIHRIRAQGLQQGRGGGELAPVDTVGQAIELMGGFEQSPLQALLVSHPQHRFRVAAERRHRQRNAEREGAAPEGPAKDRFCGEDRQRKCHSNSIR
jgi:hypothetical protein